MSKVEEFYRALVKDPNLDIKAGQTREQAARMEANYRARQYDNNTKALALATQPKESSINSLLNHVQQMSKAYSEVALLKAKKDDEDDDVKIEQQKEAFENAYNFLAEEESNHRNTEIEGGPDEFEKNQQEHNKKSEFLANLVDKLDERKNAGNYSLSGLKYQGKPLSDQFSEEGVKGHLDLQEIADHFLIGEGRGFFEEKFPDRFNEDNPLTTETLKVLVDGALGVQEVQTGDMAPTTTGTLDTQTKQTTGGEVKGPFAGKSMEDIKNLKPKTKPEGKKIFERKEVTPATLKSVSDSYAKKFGKNIDKELGIVRTKNTKGANTAEKVPNWIRDFGNNSNALPWLLAQENILHHDEKDIEINGKTISPHKIKGNTEKGAYGGAAFREGKNNLTADGTRNFDELMSSIKDLVEDHAETVANLPTETEVAVENSENAQENLTEYPKEYLDAVKNVSEGVHTNLTNLIDERENFKTAIDDAAKELTDFEATRPKGAPIDWTDAQREEWGYKITRSPEKRGGAPAQDVADPTGEGKQQDLENLRDALQTAKNKSISHENNITNLVESARPEGIPRFNAGNWKQALEIDTAKKTGQQQDTTSGSTPRNKQTPPKPKRTRSTRSNPSTESKGSSAMDDIKTYMAGQGYKKKDIDGMEKAGLFHFGDDISEAPLSPKNIEEMHNKGEFNKYFTDNKITPQGKAADVNPEANTTGNSGFDGEDKQSENTTVPDDVKDYMTSKGYSDEQISDMEEKGLFHPNKDRTQPPFGKSAIEDFHDNEDTFNEYKDKSSSGSDADANAEEQAMREEVDKLMDTHKDIIEHMYQDRYGKDNGVISLDRFKDKLKEKWYKSGFDAAEEDIAAGFKSKTNFDEKTKKDADAAEEKKTKDTKAADEKKARDEKAKQDKEDREKERQAKATKQEEDKLQRERDRKQKEDDRLRQREAKLQDDQDKKDANVLPHSFDNVDLSDRFSWNKQQQDLGIDKISKEEATHLARQLMSHKEFHKDRMNGKAKEKLDHAIFLLGKKGANLKGLKKEQEKMGDKFGTREHLQSTKEDLTHSQNHKATVESKDEHSRNQRAKATEDKVKDTPKTEDEKTARIKQLQEEGKYPDMDVARQKIADGWEYSFDTQQWHMTDWKKQQQARMKGTNSATLSHGTHQHNGKDAHQTWDAASKSFKPSKDSFTIDGNGKMHAVTDGSSPTGGPASSRKISGDALNYSLGKAGHQVTPNNTEKTINNFYPHAQHIGDTSVKSTGLERATQDLGQAAKRGYQMGYEIGQNPTSAVSSFLSGLKSRATSFITGNTEKGYYMSSDNPLDSLLQKNPETISKQRQEILKRLSEK